LLNRSIFIFSIDTDPTTPHTVYNTFDANALLLSLIQN
jgi:hypothetical protein